jgi:hypothetical protein
MIVREWVNGSVVIRSTPLTLAVIEKMDAFIAHNEREPTFPELRALAATSVPIVYRKSSRQEMVEHLDSACAIDRGIGAKGINATPCPGGNSERS